MAGKDTKLSDFEKAMRKMGVKPLEKGGSAQPTVVLRRKQSSEQVLPEPEQVDTAGLGATLIAVRSEVAGLQAENTTLQTRNQEMNTSLEVLKAENKELESRLNKMGSGRVLRLLQERGLVSHEAQAEWITGLIQERRLHGFLEQLESAHASSLERFLEGAVLIHCGRESCTVPGHMIAVRLKPDQCELCGGLEPEPWAEALSSKLMLNGIRRIHFRAQRVALLRWFLAQLDPRIQARVSPLDVRLDLGPEDGVVVLWRQGGEDASQVPADHRIKANSIGQLVTRLGYKLDEG